MEQHLPADDIETGHWGRYGHLGQWVITVIEPCARVKDGTWELTSVHRKARYFNALYIEKSWQRRHIGKLVDRFW